MGLILVTYPIRHIPRKSKVHSFSFKILATLGLLRPYNQSVCWHLEIIDILGFLGIFSFQTINIISVAN